jgi:hypothetical protein
VGLCAGIDGPPGVKIETEAAVGVDMALEQRRESSAVVGVEATFRASPFDRLDNCDVLLNTN